MSDSQLYAQVQLLAATVEALEDQVANGWKESAKLVMAELERQGGTIQRHEERFVVLQEDLTKRLGAIQLEVTESRSEMRGSMNLFDQKIKAACRKIGKGEACLEHTEQLSALNERVEQHNKQQRERFGAIPDLWKEINRLREWLKHVDRAGVADHTEGRIRWSRTFLTGIGGGGTVLVIAELVRKFVLGG